MKTLISILFLVACTPAINQTPEAPKQPEAVAAQVSERTGFLLAQIEARDAKIAQLQERNRNLQILNDGQMQTISAAVQIANAEMVRLHREAAWLHRALKKADERDATRKRQIRKAFQKSANDVVEVGKLTAELEACYVDLAERIIPLNKPASESQLSESGPPRSK